MTTTDQPLATIQATPQHAQQATTDAAPRRRGIVFWIVRYLPAEAGVRQFLDIGTGRRFITKSTFCNRSMYRSTSPRTAMMSAYFPSLIVPTSRSTFIATAGQ